MTESLSFFLTFITSTSISLWSVQLILNATKQTLNVSKQLWIEEYQAHSCGRLISAIANFAAVSNLAPHTDTHSRERIRATLKSIQTKLNEFYQSEFHHNQNTCFGHEKSNATAELYLRDQSHSQETMPKYSYRILMHKL